MKKKLFKKNQIIITALAVMIAVAGYINYADKSLSSKEKKSESTAAAQEDGSDTILQDIESLDTDITDLSSENQTADAGTDIQTAEEGMEMQTAEAGTDTQTADAGMENQTADASETQTAGTEADGQTADTEAADASMDTPGEAVLTGASTYLAQARIDREQTRSQNKETLLSIINNTDLSETERQSAVQSMVEMTDAVEKEEAAELLLEAKGFDGAVVNMTGDTVDVVVLQNELGDEQRAQIEDIVKRKTGAAAENIVITPID